MMLNRYNLNLCYCSHCLNVVVPRCPSFHFLGFLRGFRFGIVFGVVAVVHSPRGIDLCARLREASRRKFRNPRAPRKRRAIQRARRKNCAKRSRFAKQEVWHQKNAGPLEDMTLSLGIQTFLWFMYNIYSSKCIEVSRL